jgi:hypothetical protein
MLKAGSAVVLEVIAAQNRNRFELLLRFSKMSSSKSEFPNTNELGGSEGVAGNLYEAISFTRW